MPPEPAERPADALELVLYLNPASATSVKARRNLESALLAIDPSTYGLVGRDAARDLAEAEADHVIFAPTLIVRHAEAPCTLVGDLGGPAVVSALLSLGPMERSR
jgi:hypothetical protein